jgi:hypothetical protein
MNKAMRKTLTKGETSLIEETKPGSLSGLDEDQLIDLHKRVRRARNKYVKNLRRESAARVERKGSRGTGGGKQKRMAVKAEVFEDALSRVSRQLSVVSRRSAAELRAQRLSAARAAKGGGSGAAEDTTVEPGGPSGAVTSATRRGDRSLRSPASTRRVAATRSHGARRQARKDSR